MGKYAADKTVIYLDQFMTSPLLTDEHSHERWATWRQLLEQLTDQKKILIPYTKEHALETSHRDFERARLHDESFFQLCRGFSMHSEDVVTPRILINAIRNRPSTPAVYCHQSTVPWLCTEKSYSQMRALKEIGNKISQEIGEIANPMRVATAQTPQFDLVMQRKLALDCGQRNKQELITRLRSIYRYDFFTERTLEFRVQDVPFWADQVINALVKGYDLSQTEAKKGLELLEKNPLIKVLPPLYVRTCLESMLATKHMKETHNSHFDIMRLSTAIPFCDVIFTDSSMASAISDLELNKQFNCTILTAKEKDLTLFDRMLREMAN
ncbi:MAG: hypothetical protein JST83_12905 [Bacteroidetes bacterium]|nr:hypothetical protein [Bacteroidota bacterium]